MRELALHNETESQLATVKAELEAERAAKAKLEDGLTATNIHNHKLEQEAISATARAESLATKMKSYQLKVANAKVRHVVQFQ